MKNRYVNLVLLFASIIISCVVLEIGFRLIKGIPISGRSLLMQPGDDSWRWWKILRNSADKSISYEHIPNSTANIFGSMIKINSQGLRDREYPIAKAKGVYRIVGVGDSMMFGWRVQIEDTYLKLLEEDLSRIDKTEIINVQYPVIIHSRNIFSIKDLVSRLSPDMVILGFFINDGCDPTYVLWKDKYLVTSDTAEHYEKNRNVLKHIHRFFINHFKLYNHMISRIKRRVASGGVSTISVQEDDWRKAESYILRINDYLKERGIRFVIFHVPHQLELVKDGCKNPPIEVLGRICASNNIEFCTAYDRMLNYPDKDLLYIKGDGHLTKEGHIIAADVLWKYLINNKRKVDWSAYEP